MVSSKKNNKKIKRTEFLKNVLSRNRIFTTPVSVKKVMKECDLTFLFPSVFI